MRYITLALVLLAGAATLTRGQTSDWYPSRWGTSDQRGAANRVTPAKVLEAKGLIDPIEFIISMEDLRSMRRMMSEMLSKLEVEVLRLYVEGKSYQEIAEVLGRHVKSIDNALQRIKRKLDVHLAERAAAESDVA